MGLCGGSTVGCEGFGLEVSEGRFGLDRGGAPPRGPGCKEQWKGSPLSSQALPRPAAARQSGGGPPSFPVTRCGSGNRVGALISTVCCPLSGPAITQRTLL